MTGNAIVICACMCALKLAPYLVWPSKWNVTTHFNAAFSFVAYVVPLLILGRENLFSRQLVGKFEQVLLVGTCAYVAAVIAGGAIAGRHPSARLQRAAENLDKLQTMETARRLRIGLVAGILLLLAYIAATKSLPAFSSNPDAAKYFRGSNHVSAPVSVLFRLGTGILTVLPSISLALIVEDKRHRTQWTVLAGVSLFLMVTTLQRGPIATGVLLVLAVFLIRHRHNILAAVAISAAYLLSPIFNTLFLGLSSGQVNFWNRLADATPDVTDTMTLLQNWLFQGAPLTHGNTLWGGLVPETFRWSPNVWSLTTESFGANIQNIQSGGLRLPLPVWGYVAFRLPGTVILAIITGLLVGYIYGRLATIIPRRTAQGTIAALVLLQTLMATVGMVYDLGYLPVVEVAFVIWILWPCIGFSSTRSAVTEAEATPQEPHRRSGETPLRPGDGTLVAAGSHRESALS